MFVQVVLRRCCPVKVGVTARKLDLQFLVLLSVAGCVRPQLEAADFAHFATLVTFLQVDN